MRAMQPGLGLWLDSHAWIPALEGVLPVLVDELNTNLEQQVSARLRPEHLLFLDETLANEVIRR